MFFTTQPMKKSFLFIMSALALTNFAAYSQIESFPDLMEMGVRQSNLGNYAQAQAAFTKALALKPDDAIAHYNRAVTKANLKDNRGAINDFDKSLELNPRYADAFSGRGQSKARQDDFKGALQDYNSCIALNPTDANTYYLRGVTKTKLEN